MNFILTTNTISTAAAATLCHPCLHLHNYAAVAASSASASKFNNRKRGRRFATIVALASPPLLELPLLPFPKEQVLIPTESKRLHLYEARYLALLEESLLKNKKLFVHFVLDPIAVNETFTVASYAARYACLVCIEKVERLDVGAFVFIRGIGRVKIVQFGQEEPFLRGAVVPMKDHVRLETKELDSKVLELKEALLNLNSLEIKLKAPGEALLLTQTANSLKWAEMTSAIDCDEAFVPSLDERISFAALQPVSGSMQSELLKLQNEKLTAMDAKDTLERLLNSVDLVKDNISLVAAKLALQSLKMQ